VADTTLTLKKPTIIGVEGTIVVAAGTRVTLEHEINLNLLSAQTMVKRMVEDAVKQALKDCGISATPRLQFHVVSQTVATYAGSQYDLDPVNKVLELEDATGDEPELLPPPKALPPC
jgi:hypothetical protein